MVRVKIHLWYQWCLQAFQMKWIGIVQWYMLVHLLKSDVLWCCQTTYKFHYFLSTIFIFDRLIVSPENIQNKETRPFVQGKFMKISEMISKAKVLQTCINELNPILRWFMKSSELKIWTYMLLQTACSLSLGFGEDSINASAVFVMPMVSSKITGFRGNRLDRAKILSLRNSGWSTISMDGDEAELLDTGTKHPTTPWQECVSKHWNILTLLVLHIH